jgi:hypothetical protein
VDGWAFDHDPKQSLFVEASMIRTNRLGIANEAKVTRERFVERMETPVYIDIVHDDRSARPQFRPSSIHLEADVALAMQPPLGPPQLFCAPSTSLKTIASAVLLDRQPFDRIVRWRTVAKMLSIGLVVRRCFQCSAGKS